MRTRSIWKYVVPVTDEGVEHKMPEGTRILHVGRQSTDIAEIVFWAEIDANEKHYEVRTFRIFGTGHRIDDGWEYRGAVIIDGAPLVWHLYELVP